jgi:hypothetical protein
MRWAWRFRDEAKPWRHFGRDRRSPFTSARPQLELLEDRLTPSAHAMPAIRLPSQEVLAPHETLFTAGSFSDPLGGSWKARVDYGDGTGPIPLSVQPDHKLILSHSYAHEGDFDVSVIVEDNLGEIAQATLKVHAGALPGLPVHITGPVISPTPINTIGPTQPGPLIVQPVMGHTAFDQLAPGYLVEAPDEYTVSFKVELPDIPVTNELPLEIQANEAPETGDTIFLAKPHKDGNTLTSETQPAKKTTNSDLQLEPNHDHPGKTKSFQQRGTKKNLQVLFRPQPAHVGQEELASRLLAQRGPGNVLLAVLVLRWGSRKPNNRARNRWGRYRPPRRNRWQLHVTIPGGRSADARGPPQS